MKAHVAILGMLAGVLLVWLSCGNAMADLIVGSEPLPEPPGGFERQYRGLPSSDPPWKNQENDVDDSDPDNPREHSLEDGILHMWNLPLLDWTKNVWVKIVFPPAGDGPVNPLQPHGATFDPAKWPTLTPQWDPDFPPGEVKVTGVAWAEDLGSGILYIWQTWSLPQHVTWEHINLQYFVGDLGKSDHVPSLIEAKTRCVPALPSVVVLGVGGLAVMRRRHC